MHLKIPRAEFEHLAPQQPGKVRVNHNSDVCRGDSASLIISRSKDFVSCHCFRCGGRGFYSLTRHYVSSDDLRGQFANRTLTTDSGINLPGDTLPAVDGLSGEAQSWLNKAGILSPVIAKEGFLWSSREQALYITVHQYTSAFGPVLAGYIKRSFSPKDYRTLRIASGGLWGLYKANAERGSMGGSGSVVVAVEDVLSALRVSSIGYDALALCGTELHPEAANFVLTEGYKRAIVFLDGDNPTVQMKARTIAKKLSWLPTTIIETGQDPKNYPDSQLERILRDGG